MADGLRGALAFGSSPFYGVWSDAVGRRIPLAVSVAGYGLPHVVYGVSGNVWAYVAANALSGIFFASLPLGFAYVADCVPSSQRATAIGLMMATFGMSMAIGPLAGSIIAEQSGTRTVFVVSSLLTILTVLYVMYVLPESLNVTEARGLQRIDWSRANPLKAMQLIRRHKLLAQLALIALLYYTCLWTVISQILLYARRRFGFSARQSGALLMIVGIGMMISEGILIRALIRFFSEKKLMVLALGVFTVFMSLFGLAYEGWHLYVATSLSIIYGMAQPLLAAMVSKAAATTEQGQAQSSINGIKAISEGFAPVLAGCAMYLSEDFAMPGLPFLLAATLVAAAAYIAYNIDESVAQPIADAEQMDLSKETEGNGTDSGYSSQEADLKHSELEMCEVSVVDEDCKLIYTHSTDTGDQACPSCT